MVRKPVSLLFSLPLLVTFALALASCKIGSTADSNTKMYCRLACDTLYQAHSQLPPYRSAWDCKKACDEKLDDPHCAASFNGAGVCFHLNCEGTFGTPVPPTQCEKQCGAQLKEFFACAPAGGPPDRKASVSAVSAKILPEPDRDARTPGRVWGSEAESAR